MRRIRYICIVFSILLLSTIVSSIFFSTNVNAQDIVRCQKSNTAERGLMCDSVYEDLGKCVEANKVPEDVCESHSYQTCPYSVLCVDPTPTTAPPTKTPTSLPTATPTPITVPDCEGGGVYTVKNMEGDTISQPFPYVGSEYLTRYFYFNVDENREYKYRIRWNVNTTLTRNIESSRKSKGTVSIIVANIPKGFFNTDAGEREFWLEYYTGSQWIKYPDYQSCKAFINLPATPTPTSSPTCTLTGSFSENQLTLSLFIINSNLEGKLKTYNLVVWEKGVPDTKVFSKVVAINNPIEQPVHNNQISGEYDVDGLLSNKTYIAAVLDGNSTDVNKAVDFCEQYEIHSGGGSITPIISQLPTAPIDPTEKAQKELDERLTKICANIKDDPDNNDDDYDKCVACIKGDGVRTGSYTAIGCIPNNIADLLSTKYFFGVVMGLVGGVAFLLMLFGGYLILMSQGDPQRVQKGREIIISAISGVLLIVFAIFIIGVIAGDILRIPGFGNNTESPSTSSLQDNNPPEEIECEKQGGECKDPNSCLGRPIGKLGCTESNEFCCLPEEPTPAYCTSISDEHKCYVLYSAYGICSRNNGYLDSNIPCQAQGTVCCVPNPTPISSDE